MNVLIVVDNPKDWNLDIPEVEVVSAKSYLTEIEYSKKSSVKVFNLCKSYKYQAHGYYVSLLAEARGHKPIPSISTVQDIRSLPIIKFVSSELENLIQKELANIKSDKFVMSIYFGKNLAKRYNRLASHLFHFFHAPLLRANFVYSHNKWSLQNINPISANEIPKDHDNFVIESAKEYFAKKKQFIPKKSQYRYDMAILYDPDAKNKPSNEKAIKSFIKAAKSFGIYAEVIHKEDYGRLAEFDMLFIRETTSVNHHTYRFSRRAAAEGLVVMDDPESILKCTNKVYLAELLKANNINAPKTLMIHKQNLDTDMIIETLGLPIVLKQPDSSFSEGVIRVDDVESLKENISILLEKSDLIIGQEYLPTEYDWRIGIIDKVPIYACKYFMVKKHWQIVQRKNDGKTAEGNFETMPIEMAPKNVVKAAMKIANLIGDGLYGVDLKQIGNEVYVIEINDNPNIDYGVEDKILKESLYMRIISVFLNRVEQKKLRGML